MGVSVNGNGGDVVYAQDQHQAAVAPHEEAFARQSVQETKDVANATSDIGSSGEGNGSAAAAGGVDGTQSGGEA